jgi:uncharacterized protein with HEPN domain
MPFMHSDTESTCRWLIDIRHHIAMAEGFVAGVSYESFKDDNLRLYAVVRCLVGQDRRRSRRC